MQGDLNMLATYWRHTFLAPEDDLDRLCECPLLLLMHCVSSMMPACTPSCAQVTPVNERLRSGLGGTARLAVDLVQPERSEYERAFAYVFE
jgi:hypothetical protein